MAVVRRNIFVFSLRCYFFLFTSSVNWWTALCLHFIFWGIFSQIFRRAVVRFFTFVLRTFFNLRILRKPTHDTFFWNRKLKCRRKRRQFAFQDFQTPAHATYVHAKFRMDLNIENKKLDRKHQLDEEAIFRKWKCWVLREFLLFVVVFVCFRLKSESVTCVNGLHSCDGRTDNVVDKFVAHSVRRLAHYCVGVIWFWHRLCRDDDEDVPNLIPTFKCFKWTLFSAPFLTSLTSQTI